MTLFRCFPYDPSVAPGTRGGALWFPRLVQGPGRHDNPLLYGCLYATARAVSALVEQLARFTGTTLTTAELSFAGLPLALGTIELADEAALLDLDEPRVLTREALRPSLVATRERARTQADAAALFERHPEAAGLRWWSTFESQWPNVTLFDRAAPQLAVREIRPLELEDDDVVEAADFLSLRIGR